MSTTKTKCLIVEDNPSAVEILTHFIARIPSLEIVGTFYDPTEALAFLHHSPRIDLMFIDVKLPHITGLDFLKSLDKLPAVILTTAHAQYAIDGFDIGVTDFLSKPFSFERFLKAVNRAAGASMTQQHQERETVVTNLPEHIFLKIGRQLQKFDYETILYIEAYTVLSKVYTSEKMFVVSESIANLEEKLPHNQFIRVHKSYIISKSQIKSYDSKSVVLKCGVKIPLGATHRDKFLKVYNEFI
jgi:DNA-binding LytR/AlgR family response regulator